MFKLFEIRGGKFTALPQLNPKHIKGVIIISIIALIIAGFADRFNIDEKQLWKIYTAIVERLGLKHNIPEPIDVQKQIDAKAELEVDRALEEYMRWESSLPPRMTNKTILKGLESPRFTDTQRIVVKDAIYYECPGDIMGIRGVWVDKDPNCN